MGIVFRSYADSEDYHPCSLYQAIEAFRRAVKHGTKCPCGELLPERNYPPDALKWYEAHARHFAESKP